MLTRTWLRCFMCTTFLYISIWYQGTHGACNCVFSLEGKTYNITSLESKDDTAGYTIEYQGYTYSYNPCRSFHFMEAPPFGDCHDDMAMCRWISNQVYHKIAYQSTAQCGFSEKYNMPMLQYTGDIYIKKTTVLLKCNKTKEKATFEVVDIRFAGHFIFKLTHRCACPEACVVSPTTKPTKKPITKAVPTNDPPEQPTTKNPTTTDAPSNNVVVPVVASFAGFLGIVIIPIGIWQLLCKKDDGNERRQLLGENNVPQNYGGGIIDESNNRFSSTPSEGSELSSGSRSGAASLTKPPSTGAACYDITVDKKDNLNNKTKKNAEGFC